MFSLVETRQKAQIVTWAPRRMTLHGSAIHMLSTTNNNCFVCSFALRRMSFLFSEFSINTCKYMFNFCSIKLSVKFLRVLLLSSCDRPPSWPPSPAGWGPGMWRWFAQTPQMEEWRTLLKDPSVGPFQSKSSTNVHYTTPFLSFYFFYLFIYFLFHLRFRIRSLVMTWIVSASCLFWDLAFDFDEVFLCLSGTVCLCHDITKSVHAVQRRHQYRCVFRFLFLTCGSELLPNRLSSTCEVGARVRYRRWLSLLLLPLVVLELDASLCRVQMFLKSFWWRFLYV